MDVVTSFEPTQAMTLILLSLSKGDRHGYAIMTDIPEMTDGDYRVAPGTLYRSIAQLLELGLIAEAPELFDPAHDDARRTYYKITTQGRSAVSAELRRMEKLVRLGDL